LLGAARTGFIARTPGIAFLATGEARRPTLCGRGFAGRQECREMEPRWLATPTFATLASVSRKCAHAALSKAFERQMAWRGHHLTVRQVSGRGGAAGRRYEVLLSSCPADIQAAYAERFGLPGTAALPVPIEPTAALPAI